MTLGRASASPVWAVLVATAICLGLGSAAEASGPAPGLCKSNTSRGSVPRNFYIEGCFDGSSVTLRNDRKLPVIVSPSGDVGSAQRVSLNVKPAAALTRVYDRRTRLLLPGDLMRVPIGRGAADVRLVTTNTDKFYAMASALGQFIPTKAGGAYSAFSDLVLELSDAVDSYANCAARHKSAAGRAACRTLYTRDIGFALVRGGITVAARASISAVLSARSFYEEFRDSLDDAAALVRSSGRVRIGAAGAATLPAPAANGTLPGDAASAGPAPVTASPVGGSTEAAGPPASVAAADGNGSLTVSVANFPLGSTPYFCHSGNAPDYPTGGVVTVRGQVNVTARVQSFAGLCPGRSNAWIGLQGTDGQSYYSNQVDLQRPATPGASVSSSNNNGQMQVQFTGFPTGTTYYFCHSGNPSDFPTGGVITNRGQINLASANQSFSSGLCSGRGNAWIGIQGADNHDYYSNQIDLYAPPTPGAGIAVFGDSGRISLQVSGFPGGTTYYFCHSGPPSQFPTGGSIIGKGQFNVTSANQTFGPLCTGSGNEWIGVQATDGHDYYSNQITL